MSKHAIRNGQLIAEDEALVPVTSREVQSAFYVYEALRVIARHVVHLPDHLRRLESSAAQIGLKLPEAANWQSWIDALVEADGLVDATMRICVYGGRESLAFITWQELLSYPDSYYSDGVAVTSYTGERFLPQCKTGNLLLSYLALEDAHRQGAFEALLVDRRGRITEGTRSNFYVIKDGRLYTAPDEDVLSGVTRISVLRAASQLGLEVVYEAPLLDDVRRCGGTMFLSSTSMGAMPVTRLDGQLVPCDTALTASICSLVRAWEAD